ncbi:hypothetical protein V8F20_002672 [Naviculisporaceae sp. PSN 640]
MDALPVEINDQIIRELQGESPQTHRLASYASVSRGFQFAVEKWTFRSITLRLDIHGFQTRFFEDLFALLRPATSSAQSNHRTNVVLSRRAALRDFHFELEYGNGAIDWRHIEAFVLRSLQHLFFLFSTWTDFSLADHITGLGVKILIHLGQFLGPFTLEFALPKTPIITSLSFRDSHTKKCAAALYPFIQACPNLKALFFGTGDGSPSTTTNALAIPIVSCIEEGHLRNLTTLDLRYNGEDPVRYRRAYEEERLAGDGEKEPLAVALRHISRLPALEELHLGCPPMVKEMFEHDNYFWHLWRFTLVTTLATPKGQWALADPDDPDKTGVSISSDPNHLIPSKARPLQPANNILVPFISAIAHAVLKMPKLELLKWEGRIDWSEIVVEYAPPWFKSKARKLLKWEDPSYPRWDIHLCGHFVNWEIPLDIQTQLREGNTSVSRGEH